MKFRMSTGTCRECTGLDPDASNDQRLHVLLDSIDPEECMRARGTVWYNGINQPAVQIGIEFEYEQTSQKPRI